MIFKQPPYHNKHHVVGELFVPKDTHIPISPMCKYGIFHAIVHDSVIFNGMNPVMYMTVKKFSRILFQQKQYPQLKGIEKRKTGIFPNLQKFFR